MHVRSRGAVVVLSFVTTITGCSGLLGPADELESLLETLGNPIVSSSRLSAEVYRVLDEPSRAAVDARAKALGERLGVKVDADEVLQVRGLVRGGRVSKIEAVAQDEGRATLEVSFAPILFIAPAGAAPAESPPQPALQPVRLEVTRENGHWHLSLRDLGKLVASVPLEAPATAAEGSPPGPRREGAP